MPVGINGWSFDGYIVKFNDTAISEDTYSKGSILRLQNTKGTYTYSYTLKDIDDKLFDKLIAEIVSLL